MKHIAIATGGSRGDVQPYVALGQGLKRAGYEVTLLTTANFETLVTDAGLAFASTGPSVEERIQSEDWRKVIDSGNFLKILSKMQAETKREAANSAPNLPGLFAGMDLIVTGMSGAIGIHALAKSMDIPIVEAFVFPFSPTGEFPSPLVPTASLGRSLNRLSYHVTRQLFWQTSRAGDVATRKVLGLPKGSYWGPYREIERNGMPILYGYSRHVLPWPKDWDERHHVTGYWFLDEGDDYQPHADLVEFLAAGEAPVYIGFGSMGGGRGEEAGRIALEALARAGRRGVIASGWGGLKPSSIPDSVHLVSSLPHSWLFPRMSIIVHHGGAGTTAAALRAGVPSILVPFSADQPFWGRRVEELGVGPKPIPRKKLTVDNLASALTEAGQDKEMIARSSELGEKISAEDGVGNAVGVIDHFLMRTQSVHTVV